MTLARQTSRVAFREEKFLIAFFRMIQVIRLYEDNNQVVKRCLALLLASAEGVMTEEGLTIILSDGQLFVQGTRVRYHHGTGLYFQGLIESFARKGPVGFVFHSHMEKAPATEILSFHRLLVESLGDNRDWDWLARRVRDERGIGWVDVLDAVKTDEPHQRSRVKERVRETYLRSRAAVCEITRKLSRGASVGVWKAQRIVQNMVDLVQEDEALFMGLSTIKDYDDYTYGHSVNVAVLSICLGNRIGLSRSSQVHLGICGLFHDLGKVEIAPEIVKKPGKLNEVERAEMEKHPLWSARQILKLHASHDLKSRITLAPLEHHLNHNLSGYPKMPSKERVSLFGRILHIADFFDAVTSPRAYRRYAYSPDEAVRMMAEKAGEEFDPILLKAFARMLGVYPIGTLLHLDTGDMGVVCDYPNGRERTLPRIVVVRKNDRGEFVGGEIIDLDEKNPGTGELVRNILKSSHPVAFGIQPVHFLLER
ncbi:MAG TPA: HD domain-containing protein [Syntrophobacter fumaroxidans]|nr:HD domain-containing protein [Syntrophobacter fumaroxidans]